jgi:carboxylesterase type B
MCESTIDASQFGNKCIQLDGEDQAVVGNEDCLFVNVWTLAVPELVSNDVERGRAVLVFIHGGGLMTGSGHQLG